MISKQQAIDGIKDKKKRYSEKLENLKVVYKELELSELSKIQTCGIQRNHLKDLFTMLLHLNNSAPEHLVNILCAKALKPSARIDIARVVFSVDNDNEKNLFDCALSFIVNNVEGPAAKVKKVETLCSFATTESILHSQVLKCFVDTPPEGCSNAKLAHLMYFITHKTKQLYKDSDGRTALHIVIEAGGEKRIDSQYQRLCKIFESRQDILHEVVGIYNSNIRT